MKVEINNLAALVQGRELNLYQRSLAVEEWHKLIEYTTILESAINSEFNAFEKCTELNAELLALKQANGAESKDGKLPIPHVSGSLPSEEEIREPMQNALYATGNFLTDECTELATGILEYLQDAGYKVVRQ